MHKEWILSFLENLSTISGNHCQPPKSATQSATIVPIGTDDYHQPRTNAFLIGP